MCQNVVLCGNGLTETKEHPYSYIEKLLLKMLTARMLGWGLEQILNMVFDNSVPTICIKSNIQFGRSYLCPGTGQIWNHQFNPFANKPCL